MQEADMRQSIAVSALWMILGCGGTESPLGPLDMGQDANGDVGADLVEVPTHNMCEGRVMVPNSTFCWTEPSLSRYAAHVLVGDIWQLENGTSRLQTTDFKNWEQVGDAVPRRIVAQSEGQIFAIGPEHLWVSSDGVEWEIHSVIGLREAVLKNGIWVGVDHEQQLQYSLDGVTWNEGGERARSLIVAGSDFFAVQYGLEGGLLRSANGAEWSQVAEFRWNSVLGAANTSVFRTVIGSATDVSLDGGESWESTGQVVERPVWFDSLYYSVSEEGVLRSADGKSWSLVTGTPSLTAIHVGSNELIGTSRYGYFRSADGHNWEQLTETTTPTVLARNLYESSGVWLAFGQEGWKRSEDGFTWTTGDGRRLGQIATGRGVWLASTDDGLMRSEDALAWEPVLESPRGRPFFIDGRFYVLGNGIYESPDGTAWTQISTERVSNLGKLGFTWISADSRFRVSSDLVTWAEVEAPLESVNSIECSPDRCIAIPNHDVINPLTHIAITTDGAVWENVELNDPLSYIQFKHGRWFALAQVGQRTHLASSDNGQTWTHLTEIGDSWTAQLVVGEDRVVVLMIDEAMIVSSLTHPL